MSLETDRQMYWVRNMAMPERSAFDQALALVSAHRCIQPSLNTLPPRLQGHELISGQTSGVQEQQLGSATNLVRPSGDGPAQASGKCFHDTRERYGQQPRLRLRLEDSQSCELRKQSAASPEPMSPARAWQHTNKVISATNSLLTTSRRSCILLAPTDESSCLYTSFGALCRQS